MRVVWFLTHYISAGIEYNNLFLIMSIELSTGTLLRSSQGMHEVHQRNLYTTRSRAAARKTGVIQNRGDLGTLRGEMLCNAGYVHGDTSRLNVGLYGYDGIRVERTGCIRAGRRP